MFKNEEVVLFRMSGTNRWVDATIVDCRNQNNKQDASVFVNVYGGDTYTPIRYVKKKT